MRKYNITICVFALITINVAESASSKNILELIKNLQENEKSNINNSNFQKIKDDDVRLRLTADELINYYGYSNEKHTVQTTDGYILSLHRIAGNKNSPYSNGKPTVLLQHGLLCSSMDWIIAGPNRSLAFMLANRGFDVWLGNSRGNRYSRAHVTLSPDEKEFWDFSWHEIGINDQGAVIDYILAVTGNEKLTYVGHSQGTTVSYVLLSERPEYNKKISTLISLAPVAFGLPESPVFQIIAQFMGFITNIFNSINFYELKQFDQKTKTFLYHTCNKNARMFELCKTLIFLISGKSEELFDADLYPILFQHCPAGASVKQGIHFAQLTKSGYFRQFDYGANSNKNIYGFLDPPQYKLENIKVPTTLFVGMNDLLAMVKDAKKIYDKLPNQNGFYIVPHPTFSHLDFFWGKGVENLLFKKVISVILNSHN